ncbi:FkbM family methyltransferase [Acidisphaera sp. L21]|uniref:FkbM family methyltransferase n=1 Tax=Acidisphaera sp. L21 TaxID=1641851 RepID=UPI00131B9EC4|nr:FkbM family methyltransferase [Acidisphaera sp. L21]
MSQHPNHLTQPWLHSYEPAATPDDILACFRLILGRTPNEEEWTGHLGLVGQDLSVVVSNYVGSAEFAQRGLLTQAPPSDIQMTVLDGYKIYASATDEAVGRHVLGGAYEPYVGAILRRCLRPGMAMLDVGANIGVFALLAASIVGLEGSVLAIEPNPANARLLEASRLANGFNKLTVLQAAAARQTGILVLNTFDSNGTTSLPHPERVLSAHTVGAIRLDDVIGATRRIDVLKIDVEGAEFNALLGAEATLRRCQPALLSEFSPGQLAAISGIDGAAYLKWLMNLGYQLGVVRRDGSSPIMGLSVEQILAEYENSKLDHIDLIGLAN